MNAKGTLTMWRLGFFSLDAMGALLIMIVLIPVMNGFWQAGVDMRRKKAVAEHFMTIQQAAYQYGKMNHHLLMPQVTVTSGPAVTVANLKTAGCLPTRVSDVNAWGQGYTIRARRDSNGNLAMVVLTTGGRGHSAAEPEFANVTVPETAAMARAGFIPAGVVGASTVLQGAYGGWRVTLAGMGLTGLSSAGHLGSISTLSAADLAQDFLYRSAVPGRPELNAMLTDLDMSNHNLNRVGMIDFTPRTYASAAANGFCASTANNGQMFLDNARGMYLCRQGKAVLMADTGNALAVQSKIMSRHGQLIDKPVCPAGVNTTPQIFVSQSIISAGATSPPLVATQAWATDYSDTQWQVQVRVKTTDDAWIHPGANYGRVEVTTVCGK